MPAFGNNGFSATKPQAQAYRTAVPAPDTTQALSMPAYAQASGAGAAQPIQPATASATQKPRGIIPGVGVVGGGEATTAEIFDHGRSRPKIKSEKDSGGLFSPEYSARVIEEGRKNPSSPFYQREYTAEERAQSAANVAADEARVRQGYQKSGLSQASIDYLKPLQGGRPSTGWSAESAAAPSYEVYQDLARNSGGRLDGSRAAYDQRVQEQQARERNARRPGVRSPFFEFSDYSPDAALGAFYAPKSPDQQAEAARQSEAFENARNASTAAGIDFATGRPLAELQVPRNSGEYVVGADGKPVAIATLREKAKAEGWDYDTGRPITPQATQAHQQRRTDSLIARLGGR